MEATIDRLKINYLVIGEGKPFLILHGWGSSLEKWKTVAEILSQKGLKVIILDLPGFGKSGALKIPWNLNDYANFVNDFLKKIGIKEVILAGHSFGGGISVKYAAKNPGSVLELFLIASACIRRDNFKKKSFRFISKIFKVFSFIPGYVLFRKAIYKFIIRKSDYQYTDGIKKETYLKIINEDLSNLFLKIMIKTVIIWGDRDKILPVSQAEEINKKIKGSKLIIIPDADHDLEQKIPDVLAKKILENL